MNRINSSRQTISTKQRNCNYPPNGNVTPHVLLQAFTIDQVPEIQKQIPDHMDAYLISCEVAQGRYYLVLYDVIKDTWTSTGGAELQEKHMQHIKAYAASRNPKQRHS